MKQKDLEWGKSLIWSPEIKEECGLSHGGWGRGVAGWEGIVPTVSKCKNNEGAWQPEGNAKMLANFLQALPGGVGVVSWGGGADHMHVLLVLEAGGVTKGSL